MTKCCAIINLINSLYLIYYLVFDYIILVLIKNEMFHELNILAPSSQKTRNTTLKVAPVKINRTIKRANIVKRLFFQ